MKTAGPWAWAWTSRAVAAGCVLACVACRVSAGADRGADAGSGGADPDGAAPDDTAVDAAPAYPGPHPDIPQITTGGTVIAAPKIVAISFAHDPLEADIDAFVAAIPTTSYWGDVTKEYGVAPLAIGPRVHDSTDWGPSGTTVDDAQIQAWLLARVDPASAGDGGSAAPWATPDASTVYTLYFPPGVTITNQAQQLGTSCKVFHGYHDNVITKGGQMVPYAVISRCDGIPEDARAVGAQYISAVTSHEVVEAVTDPFVVTGKYGYFGTDPDHVSFELMTGYELGDMCALVGDAFFAPPDFPYLVQRIWSNASAAAAHDPCVPRPVGSVYFNSAPAFTETVESPMGKTKGVTVPVGQSKTIDVQLFSDAPSQPWKVRALEIDGPSEKHLSLTLDKTEGANGDTLHLTVHVDSAFPAQGGEGFAIVSELGTQRQLWAGFVAN